MRHTLLCLRGALQAAGVEGTGGAVDPSGGGAFDRALRQMMGGTLTNKKGKEVVYTLVRPEWMEGNPKYFTDAQQRVSAALLAVPSAMSCVCPSMRQRVHMPRHLRTTELCTLACRRRSTTSSLPRRRRCRRSAQSGCAQSTSCPGPGGMAARAHGFPGRAWLRTLAPAPDVHARLAAGMQPRAHARTRACPQVSALEAEVRTLRAALEDVTSTFSRQLAGLAAQRRAAAADIGAYEVAVVGLGGSLQAAEAAGPAVELAAAGMMAAAGEARTKLAIELSERKRALAQVEAPLAELATEEKHLDRNFRREFAEAEEHLSRLLQLYRLRVLPHAGAAATAAHAPSAPGHAVSRRGNEPHDAQAQHGLPSPHAGADAGTAAQRVPETRGAWGAARAWGKLLVVGGGGRRCLR